MRVIRAIQLPVVLATLTFSVCALGIVPTALCCQAASQPVSPHAGPDQCPHQGPDGKACPLHQSPSRDRSSSARPTWESCATDGLLLSVLTLTGAGPEPLLAFVIDVGVEPFAGAGDPAAVSVKPSPRVPPPRL